MSEVEQVERYAAGGHRLAEAVRGLTVEDVRLLSPPGSWSIQQVVVHLADAESATADRIRRVIATDNPPLLAWDENAFMAALHYDAQVIADAVALVDLTRRQLARVLRQLPPAAFARAGVHSEAGPKTLLDLILGADKHLSHHLTFIIGKRERMGKLTW